MKSWILSRYLTWIFIATSAICGCGGQDSTLIVTLGGLSSDIGSLHVVARLGDRISDKTYRAAPVFGLRLPPDASGTMQVTVSAIAADQSVRAEGHSEAQLAGAPRSDVYVQLTPLSNPLYPLRVQLAGDGTGSVSSAPSGISCVSGNSTGCLANFASRTSVTLTASSSAQSSFTGWSGACTGNGACVVAISGAATVTATFAKSGCQPGDFCREYEMVGVPLRAIWGKSADVAYAVGDGGVILKRSGGSWQTQTSGTTANLTALWGTDVNNVWVLGVPGGPLHLSGGAWNYVNLGISSKLNNIWGLDANDIWIVGDSSVVMHLSGGTWKQLGIPVSMNVYAAWGSDAMSVWIVGDASQSLRWNGTMWNAGMGNAAMRAMAGAGANAIWAVGRSGAATRFDGSFWAATASGVSVHLNSVWVSDPATIWAVGDGGTLLKWAGAGWMSQSSGTTANLTAVFGVGSTDVWVVTEGGAILHRST
jgi:hypothetical protein